MGKTTLHATNEGVLVTAALAATKMGDRYAPSQKENANAKEAPSGGGKYGSAISGSVAFNGVWDDTKAYIADSVITGSGDLEIKANQWTLIVSLSGAGALSTNQKGTFGLAGAVTVNIVDHDTWADIRNSALTDVGALTIHSESTGTIIGIAAGLSGATRGTGLAGSVSVNTIWNDAHAYVDAGSVIRDAASVFIKSQDTSTIVAVAGAIAYGGKAGVGAAAAVNRVDSSSKAYVADSDIATDGTLDIQAVHGAGIFAVAAAVGAGKGTMAAGISVSVNTISADVEAYLRRQVTGDGIHAGGPARLAATDTSRVEVLAGGLALAWGAGSTKEQDAPAPVAGGSVGVAIAINSIHNDVHAFVDDATLTAAGDVSITATSAPTIYAFTLGGSLSAGEGDEGGFTIAAAGAGSGNDIHNTIKAAIENGSTVITADGASVSLAATDNSRVTADAGGFGLAGVDRSEGGRVITLGVSAAHNDITNEVRAVVDDSTVRSAGQVTLSSAATATIDVLTVSVALGGSSGRGFGFSFAGAGSGSGNTVQNTVQAEILAGSAVTATDAGGVTLTATDTSKIKVDAGGGGIAIAGGQGGGMALTAGVSVAINDIQNEVSSTVSGSTISAVGNVALAATSTATVDALTIAAAIGAAGGKGGGFSFAGAGSGSGNTVRNTVQAQNPPRQHRHHRGRGFGDAACDRYVDDYR